jgi:hypothetical protein
MKDAYKKQIGGNHYRSMQTQVEGTEGRFIESYTLH